jgi:3-mercaptopyruvate sulfurtransferase SseA
MKRPQFMGMGFTKVFALKGGWNEWVKAELPTDPKKVRALSFTSINSSNILSC